MSFGAGSKKKSRSQTRVQIPDFLRPFFDQSTSVAGSALGNLQSAIGGDVVAGFAPDQLEAFDLARQRASGAGGFIPTAQQQLLNTARGLSIDSFLPGTAIDALTGSAAGGDLQGLFPQSAFESLSRTADGGLLSTLATDEFGRVISGDVIPRDSIDALRGFSGGASTGVPASSIAALERAAEGGAIPQFARDAFRNSGALPDASVGALTRTAQGDFLFGGEGFDAAVEAAVRAATPQVLSTFGRSGAGGATSGLAQAAIGRAATDAFASQFGQERNRQLAAADTLGRLGLSQDAQRLGAAGDLANLSLAENQQQVGAADALARLGLAGADQRIEASSLLANLGLAGQDRRLGAAGTLANLGLSENAQSLQAAGTLSDFAGAERGRQLTSAGLLTDLGNAERNRQLSATGLLPDAGLLDVNLLQQIGAQQQDQAQRELSIPIELQQLLLNSALSGLPISSLLGQNTRARESGITLGFRKPFSG